MRLVDYAKAHLARVGAVGPLIDRGAITVNGRIGTMSERGALDPSAAPLGTVVVQTPWEKTHVPTHAESLNGPPPLAATAVQYFMTGPGRRDPGRRSRRPLLRQDLKRRSRGSGGWMTRAAMIRSWRALCPVCGTEICPGAALLRFRHPRAWQARLVGSKPIRLQPHRIHRSIRPRTSHAYYIARAG